MQGTHAIEQNDRRIKVALNTRKRAPRNANLLLTRQVLPLEGAGLLGRQPSCPTATDQTQAGAHR
jgi:hypothetical protein